MKEKIKESEKKNNNITYQKKEQNIESKIEKRKSLSSFVDKILLKKEVDKISKESSSSNNKK